MSKNFVHLSDYTKNELFEIFKLADQLDTMISSKPLCGKTIIFSGEQHPDKGDF